MSASILCCLETGGKANRQVSRKEKQALQLLTYPTGLGGVPPPCSLTSYVCYKEGTAHLVPPHSSLAWQAGLDTEFLSSFHNTEKMPLAYEGHCGLRCCPRGRGRPEKQRKWSPHLRSHRVMDRRRVRREKGRVWHLTLMT